jgi:hypothetical protein
LCMLVILAAMTYWTFRTIGKVLNFFIPHRKEQLEIEHRLRRKGQAHRPY